MRIPDPRPGQVISYSYLWASEHERGQEEGLKDRPCAVIIVLAQASDTQRVVVLPITHSAPADASHAVEIPAATKARMGLDGQRSWIILTEANRFTWPGPDIRPIAGGGSGSDEATSLYGMLPPGLFNIARNRLQTLALTHHIRQVPRTE